jgi:hypothetical protein
MAKKDRKYNWPKGYVDKRSGKAKTGFMNAKKGAQLYIKQNLDAIRRKEIPLDNLTTREKAIYRALVSPTQQNRFYFEGKQYYDPTGVVRSILDQDPDTAGKKNLTNLLTQREFQQLANKFIQPAGKQDLLNISQKRIVEGKKMNYLTKGASNLDMAARLMRMLKRGYDIEVDGKKGKQALEALRNFEMKEIDKALKGKKNGNIQIFYKGLKINPFDKKIKLSTSDSETRNFDDTP